ncbi:hypothetical protein BWQ96_00886 [Gracilariopsis chorda]|uniref:DDE Tnp4 domain-containing protein n=1 Tax=Gracilariopsis chorda TaxID=448386 RepID=A0A2V3J5B5_9FLOR|nr:hypothetical protein BWQ96_00886 [Gracilariopsis chorda]|eukprot:PXF49312.1 hypothetical protein BWQ96_00886 [Gracilariopsis chorda]
MNEDSDDDNSTAMALTSQFVAQQQHTQRLLKQGNIAANSFICSSTHTSDKEESETSISRSGRGNTLFLHKATYVRRHPSGIYNYVRFQDADIHLFKKITHLTLADFDSLHHLAEVELQEPFDVRHQLHPETVRVPRKRKLNTQEILFFLFDIFGGPNEGNQGLEHMALKYGMSVGSVSNYFRHGLMALHKSLDEVTPRLVRWTSHEERLNMERLLVGFPFCVFFVDGNKSKRWRAGDEKEQETAYDGYKKCHCWALLVFCDIFGRFIRVEISDHGAESDRSLYTNSDVHRNCESYLADGQH